MCTDGNIPGIAVDDVVGNLYGVSWDGFVVVCNTTSPQLLNCWNILSGQGNLYAIAVDSSQRF